MKKIFVKTYGCAHNQADSEFMAGQLEVAGYKLVDSSLDADLVIINTCTVKDPSEKKFFSELKRLHKPVVVAGCIPQADKKNPKLKNYSLLGVKQIHNVVEIVKRTLAGEVVHLLSHAKPTPLNLPRMRKNPLVEIVPINSGCMGSCTFCKTKMARGGVSSFKEKDIVNQIRIGLNEGIKEIWITSEDSGAYGLDIGSTLPNLLRKILEIPKDFRLRLGMCNPEYITIYVDDLIEIFKDERVFKFLHIPVQSGNDRVLKAMNRPYTVKEFKEGIAKLRTRIDNITISTDIICGFPTETAEEFQDTLDLVRELKFPVVNISKFYPRAGTKAAAMKHVPTKDAKARSSALTDLNNDLIDNKEWLGWKGEILIDEIGKPGSFMGRNNYYMPIVVKGKDLLGKKLNVKIVEVKREYLIGKIV